jgi:hypothetical protein
VQPPVVPPVDPPPVVVPPPPLVYVPPGPPPVVPVRRSTSPVPWNCEKFGDPEPRLMVTNQLDALALASTLG